MERYLISGGFLAALIAFLGIRQRLRQRADEDGGAAGDERDGAPNLRNVPVTNVISVAPATGMQTERLPMSGVQSVSSITPLHSPVRAGFKPSTLNLIRVMEWEKDRRYLTTPNEPYLLDQVMDAISTAMYHMLDKETWKHGVWPVPRPIVDAARKALQDHVATYTAEKLARLLARTGASDDEVLEKLHAWDRLAFTWQKEGLNALGIAQILGEAALLDTMPASSVTHIDGWIARPVSALRRYPEIIEALFGQSRIVSLPVEDDDCDDPSHPLLFEELLRHATAPVLVQELEQRRYEDAAVEPAETITLIERTWHEELGDVLFTYAGQRYRFIFENQRSYVDVASVMSAADKLLMDLGHPDRTFRFQNYGGEVELGCFITAPEPAFREVAERLHVPLCGR